jgi:hypothetical protein
MSKTIFDGGTNPIFSFISSPGDQKHENGVPNVDSGLPPVPDIRKQPRTVRKKTEATKTRRLNLLIQPDLHEKMTKIACIKQMSVNGVLIAAVKEYCAKEARALEKYERTFGADTEEV